MRSCGISVCTRSALGSMGIILALAVGCQKREPPLPEKIAFVVPADIPTPERTSEPTPTDTPPTARIVPPPQRCIPDMPAWERAPIAVLLDRAASMFGADPASALRCADEAVHAAPSSIEAHHDRASALVALGRLDEARDAVELVLALTPDDVEALELAADLFINRLPPSAGRTQIGLAYGERAERLIRRGGRVANSTVVEQRARLQLLRGQALLDLGRPNEAAILLERARGTLRDSVVAKTQYAAALFELNRFPEARAELERLLAQHPNNPIVQHHLALVLERDTATETRATQLFTRARELNPTAFPAPVDLSQVDFEDRVRRAVADLPVSVQEALTSVGVQVVAAELPDGADLVSEYPPLSPTILGLYRGKPLGKVGDPDGKVAGRAGRPGTMRTIVKSGTAIPDGPNQFDRPGRTIVLFRRNLLRSVVTESELDSAIATTLAHELGHLYGEDDDSLRERGLE
ncbi:MAG: metallopeptidase family protein [Deltaproteobacteria bacterium]|nr:metallopeptidase family protein [Deltaproteobacteria bacterium]